MIAFGLDLILGMLLVCGLMLGLRLDKRLRGLRDSHEGFAKAVQELDDAALRTEASLAGLRAGTEVARSDLAARIDQARLLTQRLDKLMADADKAIQAAPPARGQRPAPDPIPLRPAAPRAAAPADSRRPEAAPNPRSRVLVDDDLFETGASAARLQPRVAMMGGRR